jgi:hypothetical protein
MKKNYTLSLLISLLFSLQLLAQESKDSSFYLKNQDQPIENLSVYPNPVDNNRIYISSKNNAPKEIEIYDVLGKRVLQATVTTKELNITPLTPGVYLIKIKEGDLRVTRKLIVK